MRNDLSKNPTFTVFSSIGYKSASLRHGPVFDVRSSVCIRVLIIFQRINSKNLIPVAMVTKLKKSLTSLKILLSTRIIRKQKFKDSKFGRYNFS